MVNTIIFFKRVVTTKVLSAFFLFVDESRKLQDLETMLSKSMLFITTTLQNQKLSTIYMCNVLNGKMIG